MCQHALCQHGKEQTLLPQPPTIHNQLKQYLLIVVFVVGLIALPIFGRTILPLTYQLAFLIILLVSLFIRTIQFPSHQLTQSQRTALQTDDHQSWLKRSSSQSAELAGRLSQMIQIPTVSLDEKKHDQEEKSNAGEVKKTDTAKPSPAHFLALHQLLERLYPLVHKHLKRTIVNQYSLIYHWKASPSKNKSSTSPAPLPYMLAGHLDVVPVPDSHLWSFSPFGGEITPDGYICGRGSIDDKQAVSGILSACEDLLSQGYTPQRDLYLTFGHDEEIGGERGAAEIAKLLKSQNLQFEFMLDEGLFVMNNVLPGLHQPAALVCIAEKGFLVNQYQVSVPAHLAGHASTPNKESAIGILSKALSRMESSPMPTYLIRGSPVRLMFEYLAPHFSTPFRFLFSNLWLFAPVLKFVLSLKNTTATMIRTTTALTVFHAGSAANVLPREATALINHRIHPLDSIEGVMNYSQRVVHDSRVKITNLQSIPPAPISSSTSSGYRTIQAALGRALPDVLVAPALMVGNTDTYRYWDLVKDIYRFSPTRLNNDTIGMFHGCNERIKIDNYLETIGFYRSLIQLADQGYGINNKEE